MRIQKIVRGFYSRKSVRVRKALLKIKVREVALWLAHGGPHSRVCLLARLQVTRKKTLHAALHWDYVRRPGVNRQHMFWYTSRQELDLLFYDYRLFVKRSGNNPPLRVVENNILEIEHRIKLLEHEAAVRIQSSFRKFVCRHFCLILLEENARLESARLSAVIRIQLCFRRWSAKAAMEKRREAARNERLLARVREEAKAKLRKQEYGSLLENSKQFYKQEFKFVRTGQYLGASWLSLLRVLVFLSLLCSRPPLRLQASCSTVTAPSLLHAWRSLG